ncbi:hypothetical protein BYT27DRAFT_7210898 [Phlegmacium glaucopus]|nr:hypothetical protein BYT27DRAFT_7210898 [Phlegmacium glaucopus]
MTKTSFRTQSVVIPPHDLAALNASTLELESRLKTLQALWSHPNPDLEAVNAAVEELTVRLTDRDAVLQRCKQTPFKFLDLHLDAPETDADELEIQFRENNARLDALLAGAQRVTALVDAQCAQLKELYTDLEFVEKALEAAPPKSKRMAGFVGSSVAYFLE